jgi:hypothetical protein
MNAAAVHVILFVTTTAAPADDVTGAAIDAMAATFEQSLEVVAGRVVNPSLVAPIVELERQTRAEMAVVLTCPESSCAYATIEIIRRGGERESQSLRFGAADSPGERGRAIGLLASTLLPPDWGRNAGSQRPGASEPGTFAKSPPDTPPTAPSETSRAKAADDKIADGPSSAATVPAGSTVASFSPEEHGWATQVSLDALTGISRPSAVGLTLGLERGVGFGWAARMAFKVETTDLDDFPSAIEGVGAALGVAWATASLRREGHFGLGARADAVAVRRHAQQGDEAAPGDPVYWALGGDVLGLAGYAMNDHTALTLGAGAELAHGSPDRVVLGRSPISPLQLVFELGIQSRF